ncbi:MAG: DUF5615 family PIN-like protein [Ginsengibacter sp.]
MKLLLDANLSWRLCSKLKSYFEDCLHVDLIGLTVPAKDFEIWDYAWKHNLIIVTNDDDFIDILNIKGYPPKIILLRTGNQSNFFIEKTLIKKYLIISSFIHDINIGLLEIF